MKKQLMTLVSAAAFALMASVASADTSNIKIAVVDVQQIFQKSSQVATIKQQLIKQFKPQQDKVIAAQNQYNDDMDKLKRNAATMSADDRNKLQDQIDAEKANLQAMAVKLQRDYGTAENQATQGFIDQLTGVISKIAKANGYDLVLQRMGVPYVDNKLDITNQVLAALK